MGVSTKKFLGKKLVFSCSRRIRYVKVKLYIEVALEKIEA